MTAEKNPKKEIESKTRDEIAQDDTAEILYQKIGTKWYAFSVIDEDVFMGEVPKESFDDILKDEAQKLEKTDETSGEAN